MAPTHSRPDESATRVEYTYADRTPSPVRMYVVLSVSSTSVRERGPGAETEVVDHPVSIHIGALKYFDNIPSLCGTLSQPSPPNRAPITYAKSTVCRTIPPASDDVRVATHLQRNVLVLLNFYFTTRWLRNKKTNNLKHVCPEITKALFFVSLLWYKGLLVDGSLKVRPSAATLFARTEIRHCLKSYTSDENQSFNILLHNTYWYCVQIQCCCSYILYKSLSTRTVVTKPLSDLQRFSSKYQYTNTDTVTFM